MTPCSFPPGKSRENDGWKDAEKINGKKGWGATGAEIEFSVGAISRIGKKSESCEEGRLKTPEEEKKRKDKKRAKKGRPRLGWFRE